MLFEVLGPLRVSHGAEDRTPAGPLQQALLACLLSSANALVRPDHLAATVWPDVTGEASLSRLQVHVHRLRRRLGDPGRLDLRPGGYVLHAAPDELDALQFEELAVAAFLPGAPAKDVIASACAAAALWRGAPYAGIGCDDVALEAARLTERSLALAELRFTTELGTDNHAAVLPELERLAAEHPLRERLQGLVITGLYRAGRQAEALAHYQHVRQRLVEGLGVEPGPELRGVHALVLSGEPVVARSVPAAPAQLPADPGPLHGRDEDLGAVDAAVQSGARAVLLCGTAGVGKTATALHWAHQHAADFPDGQLHVDLRGFSGQPARDPGPVLDAWLRALGVPADAVPDDTADRSAALRSRLAGRRVLVLIDNAADSDQVRPLLPGTPAALALVTSRHTLPGLVAGDGATRLTLDVLAEDQAVTLLADGTGSLPGPVLARMAARCGYLPLALRLLAEQLRTTDRPVDDVLAELDDERSRLDLLDGDGDPSADVRAVIHRSYAHLSDDSRTVLHHIGLHPASGGNATELAALVGGEYRVTSHGIAGLVGAHLVSRADDGRLTQHDLLAAYTRSLAGETLTAGARDAALTRLVRHLAVRACLARDAWARGQAPQRPDLTADARSPFAGPADAAAWVVRRRTDLLDVVVATAALPAAGGDLVTLARAAVPVLYAQGYLREAVDLGEAAITSVEAEGSQPARLRVSLAGVLGSLGRIGEAITTTTAALRELRATGDDRGAALAVFNLGCYEFDLGHRRRAAELVEESLTLFRTSGQGPHHAQALGVLGSVLWGLGRTAEGMTRMREGLSRARAVADGHEQASVLLALTETLVTGGDLAAARPHADELLRLVRDHPVRRAEPGALGLRGRLALADGDLQQARELLENGLALAHSVGQLDVQPDLVNALGRVDLAEGTPGTAVARHLEALALASRNSLLESLARSHHDLGQAYDALADDVAATRHYALALRAYDRYEFVGPPREEVSRRLAELVRASTQGSVPRTAAG